jgi:hypothetical protein
MKESEDRNLQSGTGFFDENPMAPLRLERGPVLFRILRTTLLVEDFPVAEHPFLSGHYPGGYVVPAPTGERADLVVRARLEPGRSFLPEPPPGADIRIELERLGEHRFRIVQRWMRAEIDLEAGQGEILFGDDRYVPFRVSLENFLRVSFSQLLLRRRGLLFHGAGILRGRSALVFFGPSGSGKSTVTGFSERFPILSDDMIAIDLDAEPPAAAAVPFLGVFPHERRERGLHSIGAFLRLRKAPPDAASDRIVPLPPSIASAHLLGSMPFVNDLGTTSPESIELATELARRVPAAELHFRKSEEFWSAVDRWSADGFPR